MIKIVYAGSPESAALLLTFLLQKNVEVVGVLTNPATAKGRHKDLIPTPVATVASEHCIKIFTPEHLDSNAREEIATLGADLLVCFAYGHIFGPKFLSIFKYGGINLHPSLLPKYRGCTPIPAAILNMDSETAFTVQRLAIGMDEGNILAQEKITLNGTETTSSLLNDCAASGATLITSLIEEISESGKITEGNPQKGEASYTEIISKEDCRIDWSKSAKEINAKVRAYTNEPGCFTMEGDATLKILETATLSAEEEASIDYNKNAETGTVLAFNKKIGILIQTGNGILAVKKLQRQQKNAVDYKSFINGAKDFIGSRLG